MAPRTGQTWRNKRQHAPRAPTSRSTSTAPRVVRRSDENGGESERRRRSWVEARVSVTREQRAGRRRSVRDAPPSPAPGTRPSHPLLHTRCDLSATRHLCADGFSWRLRAATPHHRHEPTRVISCRVASRRVASRRVASRRVASRRVAVIKTSRKSISTPAVAPCHGTIGQAQPSSE